MAILLVGTGATWRWDHVLYDRWLTLSSQPNTEADPIVIAIDERSLAELGPWPWPRQIHAELINRLTDARAAAIGLDLLFAEPQPAADAVLADAIARNGRVVIPVIAESERLNAPLRETLSVPAIAASAASIGHVDIELDPDGIARRTYLQAGLGAPHWPNLALAVARIAHASVAIETDDTRPANEGNTYRWVRDQPLLIAYLGAPGYFPRVSFVDVLRGRVGPAEFEGRTVLIGATAEGLSDALPTPTSGQSIPMPGVEVLGHIFRGIVDQRSIRSIEGATAFAFGAVLALVPLLMYAFERRIARWVAGAVSLGLPFALSAGLLAGVGLWWPPLAAFCGAVVATVIFAWREANASQARFNEHLRRAAVALRSITDGVIVTDVHARVQYMNRVAQRMCGRSEEQSMDRPIQDVLNLVEQQRGIDPKGAVAGAIRDRRELAIERDCELLAEDERRLGVDLCVNPLVDERGEHEGAVIAIRDVTTARRLQQELQHNASHDALTDLPNRVLLRDRLDTAIKRASRDTAPIAVVFIDLDRFKAINDSFGHEFGDDVLRAVADRLRRAGRANDTVARLGGDEFVMLLEEVQSPVDAAHTVQRLHHALAQPIKIRDQDLFISASLGVSLYPRDATTGDELLRNADAAMYLAKEAGRNTIRFFANGLNRIARRRAGLERALRRNLHERDGELALHFQPIVNLATGRVTGLEALSRWTSCEFGAVGPDEFISVAEDTGLIGELGEWALFEACRQARAWHDTGLTGLRVAVNLSPRQFVRQDVPSLVQSALAHSGLAPDCLELEITENVMLHDVEANADALAALKSLGVGLAVDDFGTGYSSLNFLQRFSVDRLKIDRSFIQKIGYDWESTAIVEAVTAMAKSLKLGIVAEGLETSEQMEFLRGRQCDEGQGFYLCKPGPAAEITALLQRRPDLRARR